MMFAYRFFIITVLLALSVGPVHAYVYKTARGLYEGCDAGENTLRGTSPEKRRRCADYLVRIFNNWNLNQDNGTCSQHTGNELPEAYLEYWRARGHGFVPSILTSAEASVNEFLDSQVQRCPIPEPKTIPP